MGPVISHNAVMALETRDWYVTRLRRATGYIERAAFRVSLGDFKREREGQARRLGWLCLALVLGVAVGLAGLALVLLRSVLRT